MLIREKIHSELVECLYRIQYRSLLISLASNYILWPLLRQSTSLQGNLHDSCPARASSTLAPILVPERSICLDSTNSFVLVNDLYNLITINAKA